LAPRKSAEQAGLIALCRAFMTRQRFVHLQLPFQPGVLAARRGARRAEFDRRSEGVALIAVLPDFIADPRP
jgi:hypothetical protein